MDLKTPIPNFNVALRGYDREEVEEYLDSLASSLAHADDAQEHIRRLQAQVSRMGGRIRELEERIAADMPKTGSVLGEKIGLILRHAEDAATDTINRAHGEAHHIESGARVKASDIVSSAEARASARTRQIEDWAQDVITHARDEEARVLAEAASLKEQSEETLRALERAREGAALQLETLRAALGKALDQIEPTGTTLGHPRTAPGLEEGEAQAAASTPAAEDTGAAGDDTADDEWDAAAAASAEAPAGSDDQAAPADGPTFEAPHLALYDGDADMDTPEAPSSSAPSSSSSPSPSSSPEASAVVSDPEPTGSHPLIEALTHVEDVDEAFEAKFDAWVKDTGSIEAVDINKLERG